MSKNTQGRRLISLLKRRAWTSMELLQAGISTCWWKRVKEAMHEGESLVVVGKRDGVNLYRVVAATKWTA